VISIFRIVRVESREEKMIKFPFLGYLGYIITKIFNTFKWLSFSIDKLETSRLRKRIAPISVKKPIFIAGLARAGTTIMLEMLSKNPDLATHQYQHLLMPYIPYAINLVTNNMKIQAKPSERVHQDGIIIDQNSPEVVEEIFWQEFFNNAHNQNISNIIGKEVQKPKFESFYKNHIKKLLLSQNASRYLTKNNYNVTRLEYLLKLFPNSKFILMIRNPINQIASLIKQTELFLNIERQKPLFQDWLQMIGHHEFGNGLKCINTGNPEMINRIRNLWKNKKTTVKGWAYYWHSIYEYIANLLEENTEIKKASYIVNYDELCENSEVIINKLIEFLELPQGKFEIVKKYYINHLDKPTYYKPNFSKEELNYIKEITRSTAERFGLKL